MTFVFLSFGFVSDFGFRVSTLVCSWRPLRLCERSSFSDTLNPNSTENFKFVWLVFDSWGECLLEHSAVGCCETLSVTNQERGSV